MFKKLYIIDYEFASELINEHIYLIFSNAYNDEQRRLFIV